MPNGQGTWDPVYGTWEPDDPTFACSRCGTQVKEDDLVYPNDCDGEYAICDSCYSDYDKCSECGQEFHIDDLTEDDGKYYCEDCLAEKEENNE